jgi:hypothetical protein
MTHSTHNYSSRIKWAALAGAFVLSQTLSAQAPAWFPLEVGNTWLYRPQSSSARAVTRDPATVSVRAKEQIGGREYFDVAYFGHEVVLRVDSANGAIVKYDRANGTEQPWLSPLEPVGATFPTEMNPCPTTAEIASRNATISTPAGQFTGALQFNFRPSCADAGITRQYYALGVGLVRSEETSFAGPIIYELVYYRTGTGTGSGSEISFALSLDAPRYPAGSVLSARLTLRSTSPDPVRLHFPSGQSFEFQILDEKGQTVYTWSRDRSFILIIRDLAFGPGEQTYGLTAPLEGLAPGRYTAKAFLTTDPLAYVAEMSFEISAVGTSK